jgi:hypothetical protein
MQVNGLVPWPIQAGPEFIHGGKNILAVRSPILGASSLLQ